MSKIAEKKAKEIAKKLEASQAYKFDNFSVVCGAIEGYDKAFQDFIEKAESFLENKVSDYFWWNQEECFVDFDKEECLEQFSLFMEC